MKHTHRAAAAAWCLTAIVRSVLAGSLPPPAPPSACSGTHLAARCPLCGSTLGPESEAGKNGSAMVAAPQPLSAGRTVTTNGRTMMMQLASGDLQPTHLMDLQGETIRFTPAIGGYHVQSLAPAWDPAFGSEISRDTTRLWTLTHFQFAFSGTNWSSLYLNPYGN